MKLPLFAYEELPSTQDAAKALKGPGVVWALRQTAGRGRWGRRWHSPEGGLWLSVRLEGVEPFRCSVAAAADLARLAHSLGVTARIKPPNDLVVGPKKLAGVLVEAKGKAVITGVGLNVNQVDFPPDLEATSLRLEAGREFELGELLEAFVDGFLELLPEPFGEFNRWALGLGRRVRARGAEGVFGGASPEGFIIDGRPVPFEALGGFELVPRG